MSMFWSNAKRLREYPTAMIGLTIIIALAVMSIVTLVVIPYGEAVRLWRGGAAVWSDSPKNAWPLWYDWLKREKMPRTIVVDSRDPAVEKVVEATGRDTVDVTMDLEFDYPYDGFPPELTLFLTSTYRERRPHVSLKWITPDGREIRVASLTPTRSDSYRFTQDRTLQRRLGRGRVEELLFAVPEREPLVALNGPYTLHVEGLLFEEDATLDAKLVVYGVVHGLAGTDHLRRDLLIALLWGTPVAMAFGLLAAAGTTLTTMCIAATAVWFGGLVDATAQRIVGVVMVLPVLPILIMIGTFYSRSIWVMLGTVILLSIFGASILSYRAIFMQVRTLPYVEAAQAYGASNPRIVFRYLVPRVLPMIVPNLVILVPGFVFLEAALAVLGLGDPVLPTWGKVIQNANVEGALFKGYYYWILQPAALLMLAGFAFAMVGFALDRVFNPRLREL